MEDFNYEYLAHEDKLTIVEAQLRELESAHFSLMMIEPSRITDAQAYGQWSQQKTIVEKQINLLRLKRNEVEPQQTTPIVSISADTEEE